MNLRDILREWRAVVPAIPARITVSGKSSKKGDTTHEKTLDENHCRSWNFRRALSVSLALSLGCFLFFSSTLLARRLRMTPNDTTVYRTRHNPLNIQCHHSLRLPGPTTTAALLSVMSFPWMPKCWAAANRCLR